MLFGKEGGRGKILVHHFLIACHFFILIVHNFLTRVYE